MAKLLLVEDDNNLRDIYGTRLEAEGYAIVTAKDGEEALAVAKSEKPDLIISDVMMPKISGFEMLDILKNTDDLKNVKVIMLTALGQTDDQQKANNLGADRYLVKSQVTLEDIVRITHELLGDQPEATPEPAAASTEPAQPAAPAPAAEPAPQPAAAAVTPAPSIAPAPEPAPAPTPESTTPQPEPVSGPQSSEPNSVTAPATEAEPVSSPEPAPDNTETEKPTQPITVESASAAEPATDAAAINESSATENKVQPVNTAPETSSDTTVTDNSAEVEHSSGTPAVTPPAPNATDTDTVNKDAASTSDETADVENQIENFVKGATSVAPTPAEQAGESDSGSNSDTAKSNNTSTGVTSETSSAATKTDDKLMDDAVNSLMTESSQAAPADAALAPAEAPAAAANADTPEPAQSSASVSAPSSTVLKTDESDAQIINSTTMTHDKVITPPQHDELNERPDIQKLYAEEQAKEAALNQAAQANVGQPTVVPSPDQSNPIDPSSIAL